MYKPAFVALILLCMVAIPVMATEQDRPSMELLEFLGDWSVDEDGWLDPAELEKMDLPEQERDNNETAKKQ